MKTHVRPVSSWNLPLLTRPCSRQPVCCSSTECGMHAANSCSASWTLRTASASEGSPTRTPAATCSNRHTSMCYSTLWRCPRLRSSCCCHWNRWVFISCWFFRCVSSVGLRSSFWMVRCEKALGENLCPRVGAAPLHSSLFSVTVDGSYCLSVFVVSLFACCYDM